VRAFSIRARIVPITRQLRQEKRAKLCSLGDEPIGARVDLSGLVTDRQYDWPGAGASVPDAREWRVERVRERAVARDSS
jgi:hypothetical protein